MTTGIEWSIDGETRSLLAAGEPWLVERLLHLLPNAHQTDAPATPPVMVATRGALATISDRQLTSARLAVLLDPTDDDHHRALGALAGHSNARIAIVPSPATIAAAEHTFLLMLALRRQLFHAYGDLVSGIARPGLAPRLTDLETAAPNWVDLPEPHPLAGATLGIIGLGRVGTAVAARARAFEMTVIYHDIEARPAAELRFGLIRRRFDQLLREAEIVSLHLPLTPETVRLIDAPELALMREHALLINTAHGRLIDEGSLIKALRERAIAGAGLDVFAYEPIASDSPLLALDNVVLTPHMAGVSPETVQEAMVAQTVEEVIRMGRK